MTRTSTAEASAEPGGPVGSVGAMLGRYRLEHEIGAGAMGVVYGAFDPDLERRIALKVLRVVVPTPEAKDRLLREARAMARLAHPNVVTVHEVGTANGRDFVAMELIPGEPLIDWLRSSRRAPEEIIDAFLAAGRGLAAAHAAGIVHRDFKPHNVLRRRDGRIAVTDFGLAREAEGGLLPALDPALPVTATSSPSALSGLTATGTLVGTPAYMAPEQWSGDAVTPATDQFAYCVALWEALAGERPYRGLIREELQRQVMHGPVGLDASKLPRRARGILCRGLDPDPARRWPNMDVLLVQLARARPRTIQQRRRRIWFALAVVSLFAMVTSTLALVARSKAIQADRERRDAVEQRNQRNQLVAESSQFYQETGRERLVNAERPLEALPYLVAAREAIEASGGRLTPSLRMLFAEATQKLPRIPPLEHHDAAWSAVFSPDGTRVVTASADHTARVWDAVTGEPRGPPLAHQGTVYHAVFSPDGTRIVTASADHTARIWDLPLATGTLAQWRAIVERASPYVLRNGVLSPRAR